MRETAIQGMGVDPQTKVERTLPLPPLPFFPSFPSKVGPLNPAMGLGSAVSSPSEVWGGVPAEIEFDAF